jgi:hypothetical protein
MIDEAGIVAELRAAIKRERWGAIAWAEKHGISPSVVSKIANGHRPPTEAIANALGFVRVVRFHKLGENHDG